MRMYLEDMLCYAIIVIIDIYILLNTNTTLTKRISEGQRPMSSTNAIATYKSCNGKEKYLQIFTDVYIRCQYKYNTIQYNTNTSHTHTHTIQFIGD